MNNFLFYISLQYGIHNTKHEWRLNVCIQWKPKCKMKCSRNTSHFPVIAWVTDVPRDSWFQSVALFGGGYGTSRMWRELAGGSPLLGQALRVCRLAQLLALSACFGELRCHCSASSSCHHTFFTVSDIDPSETISQCIAFLMRLLVMLLHQSTIKVTNTPSFQNNSIYT